MEGSEMAVGDALKASQMGDLPIGTVEDILAAAPHDLIEDTLSVPEWNCSVRLRSFTANQQAMVRERGIAFRGEETKMAWAEMEILQFLQAVIEPAFSEAQVRQLHLTSGRGFARVIEKIDSMNKIDKEALRKAREEFRGSDQPAEV